MAPKTPSSASECSQPSCSSAAAQHQALRSAWRDIPPKTTFSDKQWNGIWAIALGKKKATDVFDYYEPDLKYVQSAFEAELLASKGWMPPNLEVERRQEDQSMAGTSSAVNSLNYYAHLQGGDSMSRGDTSGSNLTGAAEDGTSEDEKQKDDKTGDVQDESEGEVDGDWVKL